MVIIGIATGYGYCWRIQKLITYGRLRQRFRRSSDRVEIPIEADAVRGRIDWKYTLSLELEDDGFNFSVLSEFRERLIAGGSSQQILSKMLAKFGDLGLLKSR